MELTTEKVLDLYFRQCERFWIREFGREDKEQRASKAALWEIPVANPFRVDSIELLDRQEAILYAKKKISELYEENERRDIFLEWKKNFNCIYSFYLSL